MLSKCKCGLYTQKPPVRFFSKDHWDEAIICGRCRKRTPIMSFIEASYAEARRIENLKARDAVKDTEQERTSGTEVLETESGQS